MDNMNDSLQFLPFVSCIESGFWSQLADKKLNVYKLDDTVKKIYGFYTNSDIDGFPCRHNVDYSSFDDEQTTPPLCFPSYGTLYNKNTIEDFKSFQKNDLLHNEGNCIWMNITSGEAITRPSILVNYSLLCFADLKKYRFHYWFAFPAFVLPPIKKLCSGPLSNMSCPNFISTLEKALSQLGPKRPPFFLIVCSYSPFDQDRGENQVEIQALDQCNSLFENNKYFIFGCNDPSTLAEFPGWPLRNFLTLISYHWSKLIKENTVEVICYRDRTQRGRRTIDHSLYLKLKLPTITSCPDVTGWERNKKNKLAPRSVNLAESMDPVRLAKSSVNLNLKLMKWRLMPSLDLDKLSSCKCLLLGAGTLGCNVARGLLGWGVCNITMVDNGTVSFSNPVRQSLFQFSDCGTGGGRPKAVAAAERLKLIYPGVESTGLELNIPMPGHPIHSTEQLIRKVFADVKQIEQLIENHDIIFLLMDTRESRWLPTMLCAAKNKLVINAALGFDSYLVMRHGVTNTSCDRSQKLGCYFCNDVVAPGNSLRDRTLDQQCTVSRPGVSMIASALAVELMASVIQHPDGKHSMPDTGIGEGKEESEVSPLGPIPHQIRGFLSNNQVLYPSTQAFSKCTACSDIVLHTFQTKGFDFLLEVFNANHSYLEDLTGLTELHKQTAEAECDILEFSDTESI